MNKHMILYRGSLKSCNYRCSYCPFSKHSMPERALEKDRIQWFSFVESVQKKAKTLHIGALMVVPYGEAMIHSWYWEGLAYLSAQAELEAVGIQTNLSFSISDFLDCFESLGGVLEKLRLWATFHPEMTSVSEFSAKCKYLAEQGIQICAGSVGVPENLNLLRALKQELQSSDENGQGIYLWVNKMDGLGRSYTQKERTAFVEIDPYFERELVSVSANAALCQGRLFVEANGKMRTCNISATLNTGKCLEALEAFPNPECNRKQCSCYLAYGGREDFMNQILFGPYPLFRVPRRPKAVFLDIEGTLLPNKETTNVPAGIMAGLEALAREKIPLFFATTLPYKKAMERCSKIRHLFVGGVFAGGAHVVFHQKQEYICVLKAAWLTEIFSLQRKFGFRVLVYREHDKLYKVTLLRPLHRFWDVQEVEKLMHCISFGDEGIRYFIEENCLQVVSDAADKASGAKMLCGWLGVPLNETVSAGDSEEDKKMVNCCTKQSFPKYG